MTIAAETIPVVNVHHIVEKSSGEIGEVRIGAGMKILEVTAEMMEEIPGAKMMTDAKEVVPETGHSTIVVVVASNNDGSTIRKKTMATTSGDDVT